MEPNLAIADSHAPISRPSPGGKPPRLERWPEPSNGAAPDFSTPPFRISPQDLKAFWQDLIDGKWQAAEASDADRWHYLITVARPSATPLSHRERHVLAGTVRGVIDKVIAFDTGLSISTVATHRAQAIQKLGLGSQLLTIQVARAALAPPGCDCSGVTVFGVEGDVPKRIVRLPHLAHRLPDVLTTAELRVITRLLCGKSNRTIALERSVSERTVANQIASAFHRLGVSRRCELVARLCSCLGSCEAARAARSAADPRD